jgi:hypothetical protein
MMPIVMPGHRQAFCADCYQNPHQEAMELASEPQSWRPYPIPNGDNFQDLIRRTLRREADTPRRRCAPCLYCESVEATGASRQCRPVVSAV